MNMSLQYQNIDTVSIRQFANNNDINAQSLRNVIAHDDSINHEHLRGNIKHYNLVKLTKWLKVNASRFLNGYIIPVKHTLTQVGEFWCGSCSCYRLESEKVAGKLHCAGCDKLRSAPVHVDENGLKSTKSTNTNAWQKIEDKKDRRELELIVSDKWMEL